MRILSWNVNGIRSNIINDKTTSSKVADIPMNTDSNLQKCIDKYDPDVICFSEVRCAEDICKRIVYEPFPYKYYYQSTRTERGRGSGYSGVAIWSKTLPISITRGLPTLLEENNEGRVIVAEYDNYYLINVYTPNSGTNEEYRINTWDNSMYDYINSLKEKKEVILVGDMNVCHQPIDYYKDIPKKDRIAGLLPEERDNFSRYIECGMVDTFRHLYPGVVDGYTWWTPLFKKARVNNSGWRLDYALISCGLLKDLLDSVICKEIIGSDHCPILLVLQK